MQFWVRESNLYYWIYTMVTVKQTIGLLKWMKTDTVTSLSSRYLQGRFQLVNFLIHPCLPAHYPILQSYKLSPDFLSFPLQSYIPSDTISPIVTHVTSAINCRRILFIPLFMSLLWKFIFVLKNLLVLADSSSKIYTFVYYLCHFDKCKTLQTLSFPVRWNQNKDVLFPISLRKFV